MHGRAISLRRVTPGRVLPSAPEARILPRMTNPAGTPIWYELLTTDVAGSKRFYETVLGWSVTEPMPGNAHGYRGIETGTGMVGGVMPLDAEMCKNGAKPAWLFYVAVDDVDASVAKAKAAGATVLMPPFEIPDIGRIAMLTDPQGNPFYVMRGQSPHASTAFDRTGMGRCNWNELTTPDQARGQAFYAEVFGWTYPDKLAMPGGQDYVFVAAAGTTIGATMPPPPGAPAGWKFYFRAPDIDVAAQRVKEAGGMVHAGPMEVPGGDRVIVASDPLGVPFGVVGPGPAAKA